MNRALIGTAVLAALLGAAGGAWLTRQYTSPAPTPAVTARKPLHYRHPMNPAVTSPVPAKDEMGMDYVPVYAEAAPAPARKILHYRHPMGLPDISPTPKKDAMGMDYLPVYADEAGAEPEPAGLRIDPGRLQKLGVKTAAAAVVPMVRSVRGVGTVEADERRLHAVSLRFDGYVEKLYANATGQSVTRGQPLMELYSPELVSAQREYLTARAAQAALAHGDDWLRSGINDLTAASLARLRNWGIADAELAELERSGQFRQTLVVRAPASGVIMDKAVLEGAKAAAGETLFRIADLSEVWVVAQVLERDLGQVAPGQAVQANFDAYPGQAFPGRVGFVYPVLDAGTRTARVRVELPNPRGLLKPMMYAHLEIATQHRQALAVPESAVLDSGRRTLVLVERGEGRFEPRPVQLGLRGEQGVEVLAGLRAGERVVVSANFLIDAESNLKSALGSFAAPANPPP